MFKTLTAAVLLAGVMTIGAIAPGQSATMRSVVCGNGKIVKALDSQSDAQACRRAGALKVKGGGAHQAAAGNPCTPSGTTKGCRDWIQGNKKPTIRTKR